MPAFPAGLSSPDQRSNDDAPHSPNVDGHVLLGDQFELYGEGRFNDTPVLIGTNSNEGGMFVQGPISPEQFAANVRGQYAANAEALLAVYPHATAEQALQSSRDVFRETAFAWPTWAWARLQTDKGTHPAWVYYFDVRSPEQPDGSNHASEMPYVFGNIDQPTMGGSKPDKATSDQMMGYWTNFAKTGNPNGPGLPEWPAFSLDKQQVRVIGTSPGVSAIPNRPMLEAWEVHCQRERAAR
jgi:para-nitrobenzyl esterase